MRKAQRARQARSICGKRYATARKNDTVARLARRSGVSVATVLRLNGLSAKTRRLRRGKRYLVYRSPYEGERLHGGALLSGQEGVFTMQRPERGWGKPVMVSALAAAARAVQRGDPRLSTLMIGDLSKEGGGCLPPHRSHRGGLDADVGYYHLGGKQRTWLGLATPEDIDADRTWQFIAALRATGVLRYAFIDYGLQPSLYAAALRSGETERSLHNVFQYPRPKASDKAGIVRHLNGHADHMHIRLMCPPGPTCALDEALAAATLRTDLALRGRVGAESPAAGPAPDLAERIGRRSTTWRVARRPSPALPRAL